MKIVTQTDVFVERLGEEEGVRALCEAGYEGLDFSLFSTARSAFSDGYRESARRLRHIAATYGVSFRQAHAPFPVMKWGDTSGFNEERRSQVLRAMEYAALLGVRAIVVHPIAVAESEQKQEEVNLAFYNSLLPYAEEYGIRVALENMWGWNGTRIVPNVCSTGAAFATYMEKLDPRWFTACLDLGHAGLVGDDAASMIRALGGRYLTALHIHDNDGIHDTHTMPYQGIMDWESIFVALREIGYTGDFTYEADNFLTRLPEALLRPAARYMVEAARYMREKILGK